MGVMRLTLLMLMLFKSGIFSSLAGLGMNSCGGASWSARDEIEFYNFFFWMTPFNLAFNLSLDLLLDAIEMSYFWVKAISVSPPALLMSWRTPNPADGRTPRVGNIYGWRSSRITTAARAVRRGFKFANQNWLIIWFINIIWWIIN